MGFCHGFRNLDFCVEKRINRDAKNIVRINAEIVVGGSGMFLNIVGVDRKMLLA